MGRLLKYIAEETQGACFTSFKFCYDTWLRQCAIQSHPWFVVTHWFSICAMWWRRNVMKSGRIGGGLADCLFVCQPFVFRKTGCLFVASQKLQNISFFRTSRGDFGEKGPERTIVWCVPGLFCCKSRACANRMLPSTLFLKEPPRAGFSRECRG